MMGRCGWFALVLLSVGRFAPSAEAQQFGVNFYSRPLCVTDPYGIPFHSWHGSPVAFNSYFYLPSGGGTSPGNIGASNGYFWGGIPAVASATTPEWVVQRTSVFPIGMYSPWAVSQRAFAAPWISSRGIKPTTSDSQPRLSADALLEAQTIDRRPPANVFETRDWRSAQREKIPPASRETIIRQVSGAWPLSDERGKHDQAEGDRLLRNGQHGEAYRRYLKSQREAGDRGEVYFRQAYALMAMGRFSHAVAKLKRGLQVEPNYPQHGATLEEIFGADNTSQRVEFLEQVADWTNGDTRDPDRLFLMGVVLHFDEDPHASDFFNSAWKLAGRGQHLQAFLESSTLTATEPVPTPAEDGSDLPPSEPPNEAHTDTAASRE